MSSKPQHLRDWLQERLKLHEGRVNHDPQSNAVKLLAYDISMKVEDRRLEFKDIEALIKTLSDKGAIARARRLGVRAGASNKSVHTDKLRKIATEKASQGYAAFKTWAETPGQAIVLTAHPTFSLSREIRDTLGQIASTPNKRSKNLEKNLAALPYLQGSAPTLQEEHADTQDAIKRIQGATSKACALILSIARAHFPDQWIEITPCPVQVYSWVGYDIDGRTDIKWGDAIRLRLSEKNVQLGRYLEAALAIDAEGQFGKDGTLAMDNLLDLLRNAKESAAQDLSLFKKDLTNTDNLVAAANNLTMSSSQRFLHLGSDYPLIAAAINGIESNEIKEKLICLRSAMKSYGLGTSRIHFRLNARHIVNGVREAFGIDEHRSDDRTLLMRASEVTKTVKPRPVNFASLALEKNTAHQQMMLTAQIHKYIDKETPIRILIAECEDSLIPLGMLYLARLYGLENHIDISPLFETADALNNGGRIIDKMLKNPVYRSYVQGRGIFAIQTGFSDAGRFMGQIPATLAIERLQSHFAAAMKSNDVTDVTAIVFNTHGESIGRGGHPGNLEDRVNYAMSPWAIQQFENNNIPLCHETSFQGGDGFLWFQTDVLAEVSVTSLICARHADRTGASNDPFYTDGDYSWDIFRTMSADQEILYGDPNYVSLLGSFGQNLLIPTGSRAAQRASNKLKSDTFNPRQLRAIPHNAILQQFGVPANVTYGLGRAANIDSEKFTDLMANSDRAKTIFGAAAHSLGRTDISTLSAYGRLYDPGFWASRALSGHEPVLAKKCLTIARTLASQSWRSRIMDLAIRLRMDLVDSVGVFPRDETGTDIQDIDTLRILHALRLAVIMKMMIAATELPARGDDRSTQLNVLQSLQGFHIEAILSDLEKQYPTKSEPQDWVQDLQEKVDVKLDTQGTKSPLTQSMISPLTRGAQLVRQATVAITHHYDAFG